LYLLIVSCTFLTCLASSGVILSFFLIFSSIVLFLS
jgi:hypothetical protein